MPGFEFIAGSRGYLSADEVTRRNGNGGSGAKKGGRLKGVSPCKERKEVGHPY
jgi:hypothetical protein